MNGKFNTGKNGIHTEAKKETLAGKIFTGTVLLYALYQLGYGIGTFLAHIGL